MSKRQTYNSKIPSNALDFQTYKSEWTRIYTGKVNGKFIHDVKNKSTGEIRRGVADEKLNKYFTI